MKEVCYHFGLLLLAALIGGTIGFERETHGQSAGLRTNILVCVGSCMLMMLSLSMVELHRHLFADQSVVRVDPGRVASYTIASMGFLGAGAIITGKGSVRGLTTAASLWLVTGLGLAVGAGFILPALFCTGICLLVLYGLRRFKSLVHRDEYTLLTLSYDHRESPLEQIKEILTHHRVTIQFTNYRYEIPTGSTTYRLRLVCKEGLPWGEIVHSLCQTAGITEIYWEEGIVP